MKRFSIMVLTLVLLSVFASTALATNTVTVFVGNQSIASDVQPILENGRIFLPVRAVLEKLGANVEWNEATQTVTATQNNTTIQITIGQDTAFKNGQTVKLDEPAKIVNNRTFVPLGFISQTFAVNVGWDGTTQSIIVNVKN